MMPYLQRVVTVFVAQLVILSLENCDAHDRYVDAVLPDYSPELNR
jgi:hypothetical protein